MPIYMLYKDVSNGALIIMCMYGYLTTTYYMMFQLQVIGPLCFFKLITDRTRILFSVNNST